jgi:hypothetical protein
MIRYLGVYSSIESNQNPCRTRVCSHGSLILKAREYLLRTFRTAAPLDLMKFLAL